MVNIHLPISLKSMKGEHMDNFILTLKDICVTETQVYTEQHQVPEDRKEEDCRIVKPGNPLIGT